MQTKNKGKRQNSSREMYSSIGYMTTAQRAIKNTSISDAEKGQTKTVKEIHHQYTCPKEIQTNENEQQGKGSRWGGGWAERQTEEWVTEGLLTVGTYSDGNLLVVYEMSRQVLPTAPSPTTTHFIVCILVSTHASCYCPAQHNHTLYCLHLGVNTCLLLLSCTTQPHTLLSVSWCQHMPLVTVLHNTTIHTVCILFFFGCQTNENVGCVLLPSLGIRLIEQEDHTTF